MAAWGLSPRPEPAGRFPRWSAKGLWPVWIPFACSPAGDAVDTARPPRWLASICAILLLTPGARGPKGLVWDLVVCLTWRDPGPGFLASPMCAPSTQSWLVCSLTVALLSRRGGGCDWVLRLGVHGVLCSASPLRALHDLIRSLVFCGEACITCRWRSSLHV